MYNLYLWFHSRIVRFIWWAEDNWHFVLLALACIGLVWQLWAHECNVCYQGCPCNAGLMK